MTKAVDYGIIQLYINGKPASKIINGYNREKVKPVDVDLGEHILSEGDNILTAKIIGADVFAKPGNMVGIDFLKFEQID